MPTFFPVYLLLTFVATGAVLECEICQGLGHSCSGMKVSCPPAMDSCAIFLSESTVGTELKAIQKTCVPSSTCSDDLAVINMGRIGTILNQGFCCLGDQCRTMTPALNPRSNKPNGKFCPACYAVNNLECKEEMIECCGDENKCLEVSGTIDAGGSMTTTVMKGCANDIVCNELKEHSVSLTGFQITATKSCKPATAGGHRIICGSLGLFLSALAGLLFALCLP